MRVYLGSDHAGFDLKQRLVERLHELGHEPVDCGPHAFDPDDDYPPFVLRAAARTAADPASLGIVIGGSGNGEAIAANKVPGVRCALAFSDDTAKLGREHNNANVVSLGARMYDESTSSPATSRRTSCRPFPASRAGEWARVPEGHTLHRLERELGAALVGQRVSASSPQGRFADGAARIDGRTVTDVWAHGKHLFAAFDGLAEQLHVHLGLYGTVVGGSLPPPPVKGALRLRLLTTATWWDLRGPTACELLDPDAVRRILDRLGPDPLRKNADVDTVVRRLARSRTPIGAALMDQSVVAGIGNVYRAELLHRHGVDPYRVASSVPEATVREMWQDLVTLMRAGVRAGRIVTTRPEHRSRRRGPASRADSFYVYRRGGEACRVCGTGVRSEELAGRTAYWCPTCQS